jgi:5'-phosphate synthase pdxT subunit
MAVTVGVLALQGDFALHQKSLKRLGVNGRIVRYPDELKHCQGLILPGGESTTFIKLLQKTKLFDKIREFAKTHPLMGTCAGLIALAKKVSNDNFETLGLIDIEAERNSYGRQVDSFIDKINIPMFKEKPEFEGVFIRAPRIRSLGKDVETLASHVDDVVMARNKNVLVMTFHPELTKDARIHRYFVEKMIG